MKRGKPLRRTPMKRTRTKQGPSKRPTKYASRERDVPYMLFVKTLPCLLADNREAGPCSGVVEADHAGLGKGMGQKAADNTCISLCSHHHRDRHGAMGFFRMRLDETYAEVKQRKREWRVAAIAKTQAQYAKAQAEKQFSGVEF